MSKQAVARSGVLVVGEALIDVVQTPTGNVVHPGGSPMNVAYGLARLGLPTEFATEFGDDEYGALLTDHLAKAGVIVHRMPTQRPTSVARATLGPDGSASYEFAIDWSLAPQSFPAAAVVHTGSIGAVLQPGAETVRELIASRGAESLVTFDPNVRPALIEDEPATRELIGWYAGHSHVVKLSDEDADWAFPGLALDQVAERLLAGGAHLVAVTRGGEGSVLYSAHARVELAARITEVIDTIGAGDAYMAGLIAAIVQFGAVEALRLQSPTEEELRQIGQFATTVASLTVEQAGAKPPSRAELESVLAGQPSV